MNRKTAILPVLLAATAAMSQAATFTYNQTVTLDPTLIAGNAGVQYYGQHFTGNPTITLQAGDVVSGTISFTNGPIHITDPTGSAGVWTYFYFQQTTAAGNATGDHASMQFLGLSGTFGGANPATVSSSGGPMFVGMAPNGGLYDFTFTGLSYTMTVTSVQTGSTSVAAPFTLSDFELQGNTLSFGAAATPEPATWGLMAAGCLALLLTRLKRATAATIALSATGVVVASAGTYTYNTTLNLDPSLINNGYFNQSFNNGGLVVQAGDVISGSIQFANGPVTLAGTTSSLLLGLAYFVQTSGLNASNSSSISLRNFNGTLPSNSPLSLNSSGGSLTAGLVEYGPPYSFSFTGFDYTINVNSVTDSGGSQVAGSFNFGQLTLQAQSIIIPAIVSTATPEPASIGLCGLGCLAIGMTRRRRAATS